MNKTFACLRNINYLLTGIGNTDHCFVRINANRADLLKFGYKMINSIKACTDLMIENADKCL